MDDLPHTLTEAIMYRSRIDSFRELPEDKQPPRDLWNKPHALKEFLDHIWDSDRKSSKGKDYFDINYEEVE